MKRFYLILFLSAFSASLFAQSYRQLIDNAGDNKTFPSAKYVTVFDSTSVFMEESGLSYVHAHSLVKILNYQGAKDKAVYKMDYDPLSAYVEINEVKIHRADGTVETVTAPVLDYVAPARAIYWGASQKMIEIGHLNAGDAVEVKTFKKGFTYALLQDDDSKYIPPMRGHFYDIVTFWSSQPILEKVYSVNVLKDKYLQFKVYNGEVRTDVLVDKGNDNRMVYTFTKKDIMPLQKAPYTVSENDIETKLLLSTSPDWYAKSKWFYGVNEDYGSFNPTPELQKKVNSLLKNAKNELDSISILTHWVADNMRYSGISMGEGEGFTLHNANMNFTDRCGVCKDKASLLIAMLRAAGFESYAAMTMAGERIDRIPADQFNHSITVVKRRNGEYQLLDPTWVPNVRELWSSAEQQQNYLMGLPEGADLKETPVSAPENHYVKMNAKSEITTDGTLVCEFTITAEGQSDNAVRRIFSGRYSSWENNVEAEILRFDPRAKIVSVKHTDNEKYLEQPVNITYKFTVPNYATVTDNEIIFTPVLAKGLFKRAMAHVYYDTSLESREYPFRDRCSRLVEMKEVIEIPKYSEITYLPENASVDTKYIKYNGGYSIKDRTITFNQVVSLGKRIYEPEEWTPFKETVKAQNNFSEEKIIIER